jgi:hypothetical protein
MEKSIWLWTVVAYYILIELSLLWESRIVKKLHACIPDQYKACTYLIRSVVCNALYVYKFGGIYGL